MELVLLAVLGLTGWVIALLLLVLGRKKLRTALANTEALNTALGGKPAEVNALIEDSAPQLLTIEILNPMELAAEKSWIAGTISSLSPGFIRRKVYEQTREILKDKLVDFGVEAEVKIYRG